MPKCKEKIVKIGATALIILPKKMSDEFPSRGMCMGEGSINGVSITAPLEPDGKGSHYYELDNTTLKKAKAKPGDTVELKLEPTKEWPEPNVPADLKKAVTANKSIQELWLSCTVKARWDWIRWVRSTKNPDTRAIRIDKTISKLKDGKKSPCCFNRSACTDPAISKGGILLDPNQ